MLCRGHQRNLNVNQLCHIERISFWGQRIEPKRGAFVVCDGTIGGNWREAVGTDSKRLIKRGVYLGEQLVACVEVGEKT